MILAIDRGNSKDKFAVFEKDSLIFLDAVEVFDELSIRKVMDDYAITDVIFSSVKDEQSDKAFLSLLKKECSDLRVLEFDRTFALPFINNYEDKQTIGLDRLAAISGASLLFGKNVLVVDAGTCITFDYLDSNNIYQGGSISLGFYTKYKALHNFTANLPLMKDVVVTPLCAKTTKDCIISGVVNGTIFEVEATIKEYKDKAKDLRVILTGGDAKFLQENLSTTTLLQEDIVLYGLKKILDINA